MPAMFYRIAADAIVVAHFAYVIFVIVGLFVVLLGGLLGWQWVRNRWFRLVHLSMILVVVLEAWAGITCPLTTWENNLRVLAGDTTYEGAFIANLVHRLLFYENVPKWIFTAAYTTFGSLVAGSFWLVPVRWRGASGGETVLEKENQSENPIVQDQSR